MFKHKPFDTSASIPSRRATVHIYSEFLGAMAISWGLTLSRKDLGLSVSQYSLIISTTVSEQMHQREKVSTSWLFFCWKLSSLLCYYFGRRNAIPKGRETDGPIPNCRSSVSRLYATSVINSAGSTQSNQMPKLRPCTPISVCGHGCFTVQSGVWAPVCRALQKRRLSPYCCYWSKLRWRTAAENLR